MLKQRVLTAIALIVPLLVALFFLPPVWLAGLLGLFMVAGTWEWATLAGLASGARRVYGVIVTGVGAAAVALALLRPEFAVYVLVTGALWWVWAGRELARSTATGPYHTIAGKWVIGMLMLIPTWTACVLLRAVDPQPPRVLLFLFILVAVADTAAYAAGHAFGRTKLAPRISPGKTLEGVIGGVLAVIVAAYFYGKIALGFETVVLGRWIGVVSMAAIYSVVGDLSESKMKRIAGVKDSGWLLPGHGGVLDRIDALTAAAPIYALGWWLFVRAPT